MTSVGEDAEELEPPDKAGGALHRGYGVYHIQWYSCSEMQTGAALWQSESAFASQEEEMRKEVWEEGTVTLGTFTDKESGTSLESWALVCLPVGMWRSASQTRLPETPWDTVPPPTGIQRPAVSPKRMAVSPPWAPGWLPRIFWAHLHSFLGLLIRSLCSCLSLFFQWVFLNDF